MVEFEIGDMVIYQRCRVCREKFTLLEMESHVYTHYNYCKYGHYEEFDIGDPRWPECMAERHDLFPVEGG